VILTHLNKIVFLNQRNHPAMDYRQKHVVYDITLKVHQWN